jgi:L-alanine-DL-glutamate epimerase-like enolase superfamily enzyme
MPKIKHIEIEKVDLALTRPYTIAFKTVDHVENAIVTIELDNGIIGKGAGNPSEQVVGENLEHGLNALRKASGIKESPDWDGLIGRDIDDLETLCEELQVHLASSPCARTALEVGLFDCYALYKNIPLVGLLGQEIERMPTSITIGIKDVPGTIEEAGEYFERGFRYIKVKLGNNLDEDVERLVKLREAFGDKIKIRVDANQGYTVAELQQFYDLTASCKLELIEQPLPAAAIEQMRAFPKVVRQLLAADESLIGPADAEALIADDPACGIFNIKLMKCGGITQAKEISRLAQAADIELMWGCNDESIISIAAALHTALSCKNTRYLDLDGSLDLAKDVVSGGFELENGEMSINGLPGLGLKMP